MSRCQLICELSTNHGGDVDLAAQMIQDAAQAGADWVKIQTYSLERLNPADPQAAWLRQAHLDREDHQRLIAVAKDIGVRFLSTPFDAGSLQMLRDLGLTAFKIASSESRAGWWAPQPGEVWFVSVPWGASKPISALVSIITLTAIPLYPTPLECVGQGKPTDGWSDHTVGVDACLWALAHGAQVLEVHVTNGQGRVNVWDKTLDEVRQIRAFAEACETMRTGVKQQFRDRWSA